MLLCLVKACWVLISGGMAAAFRVLEGNGGVGRVAGVADKTGKGRSGRGQALIRSRRQQAGRLSRGRPTNRSKASTDAAAEYWVRPPPGSGVSPRRRAGSGRPRGRRNA